MEDLRSQVRNAIQEIQAQVKWRPGSETGHLLKRKVRNHLPLSATLADYEHIISAVVTDREARVFVYRHGQKSYPTVVTTIEERQWLVMFDLDGVLESAYIVERPDRYLNRSVFELVGTLGEILDDEPH
jgi:hypothetical protein